MLSLHSESPPAAASRVGSPEGMPQLTEPLLLRLHTVAALGCSTLSSLEAGAAAMLKRPEPLGQRLLMEGLARLVASTKKLLPHSRVLLPSLSSSSSSSSSSPQPALLLLLEALSTGLSRPAAGATERSAGRLKEKEVLLLPGAGSLALPSSST